MKNVLLVLISCTISFTLSRVFLPARTVERVTITEQHKIDIEALKNEIKAEIIPELKNNYAKIDTISTSHGVNIHVNDFRERTEGRLPDLGLGIHSLK